MMQDISCLPLQFLNLFSKFVDLRCPLPSNVRRICITSFIDGTKLSIWVELHLIEKLYVATL